jgi:hypothetical protein
MPAASVGGPSFQVCTIDISPSICKVNDDSILAIDYELGSRVGSPQFPANDAFSIAESGPDFDVGASPNLFVVGAAELVGVGDKGGRFLAVGLR